MHQTEWWTIELEGMPHFDMAMKRVYAWFENEIIDRLLDPVDLRINHCAVRRHALQSAQAIVVRSVEEQHT